MSTIVQIQVNVNDTQAIASLTNIENIGKRLSSTPIEIKINAGAINNVSKSVVQLAREQTKQATASAKQATAEAKVQTAQEKTRQTANRLATQQAKTAQSANKLATQQSKAASSTNKMGTEAQKTSALTGLLGDSLGRIIAKQAVWQVLGNAIAGVTSAFKNAFSALKDVDKELAEIKKVTKMSSVELNKLGDTAYATASKYGASATSYLEHVAAFTRAGYRETAEGLAELALKTEIVGNTTSEVATKFLLSTDAAFKFHGSISQLSDVLDKASVIDSEYATELDRISEGFPIVASTAQMSNMSVEELIAALGTITAVTQESGTKAATALRALILNVMKDTTTEVEEGVTVTTEQIDSLYSALQKYAPEAIAAAEATGKIIDPMEAIGSLAKAYQDGLLTESELVQLASDIGGKLRTNQLLALIQHWDMFESMMSDMGESAGSADEKVSIMMDTWDAKAKVLTNTWTEFIAHMDDTSAIKGGLDVIIGLIQFLDSEVGHFVVTTAGLTAAFALISKGAVALKTGITALALAQGPLAAGTLASAAALKTLTAAMLANPLFWVAGATAVIYGIVKAVDALTVTYEEQAQILSDLESEYETTYGKGTRFDELKNKVGELTAAEEIEYNILKMRNDEAERQLKLARDAEYDKWMNANWVKPVSTSGSVSDFGSFDDFTTSGAEAISKFRSEVASLNKQVADNAITQTEYKEALLDVASGYDDLYDKLVAYKKDGRKIGEDAEALIALYESIAKKSSEIDTGGTDAGADSFEEVKSSVDAATEALQRYNAELDGLADKEANANAMQTAFNNAMKDFQAGKVSSAYVKSFYDQFIPDDIKQQFGYSVADAMEWAMSDSNLGKIFNSGDMFGAFYDVINEAAQGGSLDGIVSFDDSGAITAISSYKELAEQLGITEGMAQALAQGLSVYMDGVFYTGEEASNIVSQLGDKLGEGSHSLSDYASALSQITGQTTVEGLLSVFEGLERAGAINWADKLGVGSAEEARGQIISTIEALLGETDDAKAKAKEPVTFDVDAEIDEANAKLAQLDEKKKTASGSVDVPVTVPGAAEAEQQLGDVKQAKDDASGDVESGVDASGAAEAASELRDVGDAANEIPDSKQIHVSVRDNASGVLNAIYSRLASIRSKTVTITTIEKKYKQTASGALIPTNAGGTQNSPGGRAVVNDGAPVNGSSAELIVDNGDAYIANGGKMAIVDLSPGAKVYTAKQTQDMLTGEKEEIPMHAGGTGLVRPGGNGGVYGGDHSGGTGVGGSTASNTEEDDPLKKEVSEKLDNIDKQIELARNRNDRAKEQALQEQAAKLVRDFVQQYLDKGYSNTSNEVLDLLNRGYGYSDDLMGELVDSLKALTDSTNAANKLSEKQQAVEKARQELENTKKQRTVRIYNPVTGQWEWVAKADDILKAQENLTKAEKEYQDTKIEQELDAIKNGNIGDIGDLTMSPALRELISNASDEEQKRIADILHAISGGAKSTTDTTGESIFRSTDSHDVYYQFGDLKLSEAEAKNMTVKELAEKLKTLKLT